MRLSSRQPETTPERSLVTHVCFPGIRPGIAETSTGARRAVIRVPIPELNGSIVV